MSTETYIVTPRRWAHGWELYITDLSGDEIGVTQSDALSDAEQIVRDYLAHDGRDANARVVVRA